MRFEKVQSVLDAVSTAVAVNVALVVTSAPLLVLLVFADPFASWPLVAVAAVLASPGLTAAFTVFRSSGGNPFRVFAQGYLATWTRAALVGLVAVGAGAVLLVDVRFFADTPYAQAAMIVLVVVAVLVAGVALLALAAIAEEPTIRVRDALRIGAWYGLHRWYLTLVSLAVLVAFGLSFINLPLLALSVVACPALYLAWSNCRYTLRPALVAAES